MGAAASAARMLGTPRAPRVRNTSRAERTAFTARFTDDVIPALLSCNLPDDMKGKLMQQQTVVATADAEARAAVAEAATTAANLQISKLLLEKTTVELLRTRGMMDMRGALQIAQERLLQAAPVPLETPTNRRQIWVHILNHNNRLLKCLLACMYEQPANIDAVAGRIVGLYRHLSTQIHNTVQASATAVDIVEGPVNTEQMGILVCVLDGIVPCNIVPQRSSSIDGSDDSDKAD